MAPNKKPAAAKNSLKVTAAGKTKAKPAATPKPAADKRPLKTTAAGKTKAKPVETPKASARLLPTAATYLSAELRAAQAEAEAAGLRAEIEKQKRLQAEEKLEALARLAETQARVAELTRQRDVLVAKHETQKQTINMMRKSMADGCGHMSPGIMPHLSPEALMPPLSPELQMPADLSESDRQDE
eukprot:TRINITY_DN105344_c0_g1_i1.p1 TRINITY_DN105344_c0_g1~~TRINITY_DN105344_c0_g1_i1.p1  ORF type:complete len:185 (-),score=51.40 TRINITY_DN105344_c0_g1_i1:137-691(-)